MWLHTAPRRHIENKVAPTSSSKHSGSPLRRSGTTDETVAALDSLRKLAGVKAALSHQRARKHSQL